MLRISSSPNILDKTNHFKFCICNYLMAAIFCPVAIILSSLLSSHLFLRVYYFLSIYFAPSETLPFLQEIIHKNGNLYYLNPHLNYFIAIFSLIAFVFLRCFANRRFTWFRCIAPSDLWSEGSYAAKAVGMATANVYAAGNARFAKRSSKIPHNMLCNK